MDRNKMLTQAKLANISALLALCETPRTSGQLIELVDFMGYLVLSYLSELVREGYVEKSRGTRKPTYKRVIFTEYTGPNPNRHVPHPGNTVTKPDCPTLASWMGFPCSR